MALNCIVGAANHYLQGGAPATAAPLSISLWFRQSAGASGVQTLCGLFDASAADEMICLELDTANLELDLRRESNSDGADTTTETTNYVSATNHHACAILTAVNNVDIYLDGATPVNDTTSVTPINIDRFSIGRRGDSTPTNYFHGDIWEIGIWNVALTAAEVAILATGISPKFIRPESLVAYWSVLEFIDIPTDDTVRVELHDQLSAQSLQAEPRLLGVTLVNATYDDTGNAEGELHLSLTGAFANYTFVAGDIIYLENAVGGVADGEYAIASKVDDDAILLSADAGLTADSTADVDSVDTAPSRIEHPRKHLWPDPLTGEPSNNPRGGSHGYLFNRAS